MKLNKKEVNGKEEPVYVAHNIGMHAGCPHSDCDTDG